MEKFELTTNANTPNSTKLVLVQPSEEDNFDKPILLSRDSEGDVTTITPYTESDNITSVADLAQSLTEWNLSENDSYSYTDRQIGALHGYEEELSPALYILADCCAYRKIKPVRPITVLRTLLKRYFPTDIVHRICCAD